jgi:hypothetical protein
VRWTPNFTSSCRPYWKIVKSRKVQNQGKQRKTVDWYYCLPWSYTILNLSLHSIIMLNFLQTFKTVKLTFP